VLLIAFADAITVIFVNMCFDTVGWASGRASGLCWYGYVSEARCILFAYGSADATVSPKPHRVLPQLNPDWFYLSGTGLPRLFWKRGGYRVIGYSSSSSTTVVKLLWAVYISCTVSLYAGTMFMSHIQHCVYRYVMPQAKPTVVLAAYTPHH